MYHTQKNYPQKKKFHYQKGINFSFISQMNSLYLLKKSESLRRMRRKTFSFLIHAEVINVISLNFMIIFFLLLKNNKIKMSFASEKKSSNFWEKKASKTFDLSKSIYIKICSLLPNLITRWTFKFFFLFFDIFDMVGVR